jgi:hypothetical protein
MSRRGRRTAIVMTVLFSVVFGPILLFSWKDWNEVLLLGVQHPSILVDYVWNFVMPTTWAPTPVSTSTLEDTSFAAAANLPLLDGTATRLVPSNATSTHPWFYSLTPEDRSRPSSTPSRFPSRTPTRFVTRTATPVTATLIGTRTPTKIPTSTLRTTLTLRPTYTLPPTLTPVPTDTPVPPPTATHPPTPTRTRRPTRTPTPKPPPTQPPPTSTDPPPYP